MYSFGSGVLYGVNTTANSTPARFGGIQDFTLDFSFDVKELYGQYQFALAIARGKAKVEAKAKLATINGAIVNSLFFGATMSTGITQAAVDEGPSPIPTTPFQITAANGATFLQDLGVQNAATGLYLVKVPSAPTTGQYSVSGVGVYLFAAADTGNTVRLNYTYTTAATGNKIAIVNQLLGTTPMFSTVFFSTFQSKKCTFTFSQCTSKKFAFATKLEDFIIPEVDFSICADAAGNVGTLSFDE